MSEMIDYMPARDLQHVPALRKFFDELLPHRYPEEFYAEAVRGSLIPSGVLEAKAASASGVWWYSIQMAVHGGRLVGAVVMAVTRLADLRRQAVAPGSDSLPYLRLTRGDSPEDLVVHVLLLAVGQAPYRRRGIGSELLSRGLQGALRAAPGLAHRVKLAFLTCQGDATMGFYQFNGFTLLGVLPDYYPEKYRLPSNTTGEANFMVFAIGGEDVVVEFEPQVPGQPPNLLDAHLQPRKKMPPWVRTLLLYYVLPIAAVALLFAVCYLLVLLGPLRGISGTSREPSAPAPGFAQDL